MKTKLAVIAGICICLGIALLPVAAVQAAGNGRYTFQNAENPAQLQCVGQQKGNRTGPRDGTKGENAPRDGRGQGRGQARGGGQRQGPQGGMGPRR